LLSESRTTIDGVELGRKRWGDASDEVVNVAVGLTNDDERSPLTIGFEVGIGQGEEGAPVEATWAVVADPRLVRSVEERIAELEAMGDEIAARLADDLVVEGLATDRAAVERDVRRSVAEEIEHIRSPRPEPPDRALSASDTAELETRPEGPVAIEACGPRLGPLHLPRHMLKLDVVGDEDSDRAFVAATLRAQRSELARDANRTVRERLSAFGAEALAESDRDACVTATVPSRSAVQAIADVGYFRRVTIVDRPSSAHAEAEFRGDEIRLATQIQQFWDAGFDGETPSTRANGFNDLTVGIVDEGFQDNHIGMLDTSLPTSKQRVKGRFHCNGAWFCGGSPNDCTSQSDLQWETGFSGWGDNPVDHGTTIAAILVSDFMDGQDPSGSFVPASDFSGYAPEGGVVFLQSDDSNTCGNRSAAIQRGVDLDVDVISMSVCAGVPVVCGSDENKCSHLCACDGNDDHLNKEVNDAFKDGVLVVKAAGNEGATNPGCCECTVTSPGDAEGALAVGGHGDDEADASTAPRAVVSLASSSRGRRELRQDGGVREGTVVGISAPRVRRSTASCEVQTEANCFARYGVWIKDCPCFESEQTMKKTGPESGTSYATPTVAAASLLMKDAWVASGTPLTWLDQAEIMKLRLLANGDRLNTTAGAKRTFGLSGDYGAGRMRMRMTNAAGMDAPWHTKSGWSTISDGTGVQKWVSDDGTPKPLPADVDAVKVVAWWYEPRTETGGTRASHITMKLDEFDSTCTNLLATRMDSSFDTKKMIFDSAVGSRCLRIEIFGNDVTIDDENNNSKSRRVNWMFIYEDSDRDDSDGPVGCTALGVPANCVEPL
jgi:hypothetical protein